MGATQKTGDATPAKKTTGRKNGIANILVDRINREHLRAAAKGFGIEFDDETSDDSLSTRLYTFFTTRDPAPEMVECTVEGPGGCGGAAPVDLDGCPYCGAKDIIETSPLAVAVAEATPPPAGKGKKSKAATEAIKAEVVADDKTSEAKMTKANGAASTAMVPAPKAGALKAPALIVGMSEQTLDEHVAEFVAIKSAAAVSFWKVANAINFFLDSRIWSLRTEKGEQRYKTFDAFCNAELAMGPTPARRMAAMAKQFNEEEFRLWGKKKMELLIQAPPEDRKRIKDALGPSAPKRVIEKEIRAANKKNLDKGIVRADRDGRVRTAHAHAAKAAKAATVAAEGPKTITVANIEGVRTVALFKSPAPKVWNEKEMKRARTLAEDPVGRNELSNGVVQVFKLVKNAAGELAIKITTSRVSE